MSADRLSRAEANETALRQELQKIKAGEEQEKEAAEEILQVAFLG